MSSALSLQGKHQSQNSNASLKSNVKLNEDSRISPNNIRESEIKSNSAKGLSGTMDPRYYRDVNEMQMFDRQKYYDDISNTFRELSADFKSKYKKSKKLYALNLYEDNYVNPLDKEFSILMNKTEIKFQKKGKLMHKSKFRNISLNSRGDGSIFVSQIKKNKNGENQQKKLIEFQIIKLQKFDEKIDYINQHPYFLDWEKQPHHRIPFRVLAKDLRRKPKISYIAFYFDDPIKATEFIVRQDKNLKDSFKNMILHFETIKINKRREKLRSKFSDKIKIFADQVKKDKLHFFDKFDVHMTTFLIQKWRDISISAVNAKDKEILISPNEPKSLQDDQLQKLEELISKSNKPQINEGGSNNFFEGDENLIEDEYSAKLIEKISRLSQSPQLKENLKESIIRESTILKEQSNRINSIKNSIQNNQAFLDLNKFFLLRFVNSWRKSAVKNFEKMAEEAKTPLIDQVKSVIITVEQIILNSNIPGNPSLKLTIRNENSSSIKISLLRSDKDKEYFINRSNSQTFNLPLVFSGLEENDLVFDILESNQYKIYSQNSNDLDNFLVLELNGYRAETSLKNLIDNKSLWLKSEKFTTKINILINNNQLIQYLDLKKNIVYDPNYFEAIQLPKFNPKHLSFLIDFLIDKKFLELSNKYNRLAEEHRRRKEKKDKEKYRNKNKQFTKEYPRKSSLTSIPLANPSNKDKDVLEVFLTNLADHYIIASSKFNAKLHRNSFVFNEILTVFHNSRGLELENSEEEDFDREGSIVLNSEFYSIKYKNILDCLKKIYDEKILEVGELDNIKKIIYSKNFLGNIGKLGIPQSKRALFYMVLANIQGLRLQSEKWIEKKLRIKNWDENNKYARENMTSPKSYLEIYEYFKKEGNEVPRIINQQIEDDLTIIYSEESSELKKSLKEILIAYCCYISFQKENESNINNNNLNYSPGLMRVCRRVIALCESTFLIDVLELTRLFSISREEQNKDFISFWTFISIRELLFIENYESSLPSTRNSARRFGLGLGQESLILKQTFLLKEFLSIKEKALFEIFLLMGLPLEYFTYDAFLDAGAKLFSCEKMFRVWDWLVFMEFEKRAGINPVEIEVLIQNKDKGKNKNLNNNNTIRPNIYPWVAILITFFREIKGFIINTDKTPAKRIESIKEFNDLRFVVESIGKFDINIDVFLQDCEKTMEELAIFEYERATNLDYERKQLAKFYERVQNQNSLFSDLIHGQGLFKNLQEEFNISEILKILATLKNKHKHFESIEKPNSYEVPNEFDSDDEIENDDNKPRGKYLREQYKKLPWFKHFDEKNDPKINLNIYFHRLNLFCEKNEKILKLYLICDGIKSLEIPIKTTTCNFINYYHQIVLEKATFLEIELIEETVVTQPANGKHLPNIIEKIKKGKIFISHLLINVLYKMIIPLEECQLQKNLLNKDRNLTTSEVEISLILGANQKNAEFESILAQRRNNENDVFPLFKSNLNGQFNKLNFESFHKSFIDRTSNILSFAIITNNDLYLNRAQIKQTSAINYEDFRQTLREAKFLTSSDSVLNYTAIYDAILCANGKKFFSFEDFLIGLVLFSKTTTKRKICLFYEILTIFDPCRKLSEGISLLHVKQFCCQICKTLMLTIPDHEIENIVESVIFGSPNRILSARIQFADKSENNQKKNISESDKDEFGDFLSWLSLYTQENFNSKSVLLGDNSSLYVLKEIYSKCLNQIPQTRLRDAIVSINYRSNGIKHKVQLQINEDWEIVKKLVFRQNEEDLNFERPENYKLLESLLFENENIISLNSIEKPINQEEFMLIIEKLPFVSYFLGNCSGLPDKNEQPDDLKLKDILFQVYVNENFVSSLKLDMDNINKSQTHYPHPNEIYSFVEEGDSSHIYLDILNKWSNICNQIIERRKKGNKIKNYIKNEEFLMISPFAQYKPLSQTLKSIQQSIMASFSSEAEKFLNKKEYLKIFKIDFRKPKIILIEEEFNLSGLSEYSLVDLAWNLPKEQNRVKIQLKYKTKEKIPICFDNLVFEKPDKFDCLGLYHHSNQSKDWIPCRLIKKIYKKDEKTEEKYFRYYEIIFDDGTNRKFLKKNHELYIPSSVFTSELMEENRIEKDLQIIHEDFMKTNVLKSEIKLEVSSPNTQNVIKSKKDAYKVADVDFENKKSFVKASTENKKLGKSINNDTLTARSVKSHFFNEMNLSPDYNRPDTSKSEIMGGNKLLHSEYLFETKEPPKTADMKKKEKKSKKNSYF